MGTIECTFCKALLPGDSRYCYLCGNALGHITSAPLEAVNTDLHEHHREEDIPTGIATYNVLTDIHSSIESLPDLDPDPTPLDVQSSEGEPLATATPVPAEQPITDEAPLLVEQENGELLIPMEEDVVSNEGEEESAEQEPVHLEEAVAPLSEQPVGEKLVHAEQVVALSDEQPLDEQPTHLEPTVSSPDEQPLDEEPTHLEHTIASSSEQSVGEETVPMLEEPLLQHGDETIIPDTALLDDDPANAITEPSMLAIFARANARQMSDEEELAGYVIPASMSSVPLMPQTSRRAPLSRIVTVVSTIVILLAAVSGLLITGLPLVHGEAPPALTVSGNASPGSTLTIHGSHFRPTGSVTVLVDDSPIASTSHKMLALASLQMAAVGGSVSQRTRTDNAAIAVREDGSFEKTYIVPDSWQPGSSHTIRATEAGTNGNTIGAQLLVKVDNLIQPAAQTPQPAVNPQVTVVPVSTVVPTVPVYPGPPQPANNPPKKTPTPKPVPKKTPTPRPTPTKEPTPTPTPMYTPTPEPTATPTPVPVDTPTPVPTTIPTPEPPTPTPVPIVTPTPEPPTPTPTPIPIPVVTPTPTYVPIVTPTPTSESSTPTPTPIPIPVVTPTPTHIPRVTPTPTTQSLTPTPTPTAVIDPLTPPAVPTLPAVPTVPSRRHH